MFSLQGNFQKIIIAARNFMYILAGGFDSFLGRKPKVVVFCYHGISDDGFRYSVKRQDFQEQINYLLGHGYTPITLTDLHKYLDGELKITKPSFLLTFDDGYSNILSVRDFLNGKRIKPVVFVLSDEIKANFDELGQKFEFMATQNLQRLLMDGWAIGCHSATHADFATLTDSALTTEIVDPKQILETTLGTAVTSFSYPKGRYGKKVENMVLSAAYKSAFTMDDGILSSKTNPLRIPRVGVDSTHTMRDFKYTFLPSVIALRGVIKKVKLLN